jgi:hypothetical protein
VALQLATPRSFKDEYTNILVYELRSFLGSRRKTDGIFEGSRERWTREGARSGQYGGKNSPSFCLKRKLPYSANFTPPPQGMREKYVLFRCAAVARSTFKIY